jgi:hypothetical protein
MSKEAVEVSSPINRQRPPGLPSGPKRAEPVPIRGDRRPTAGSQRTPVKDSDKAPPIKDGAAPSGRGR